MSMIEEESLSQEELLHAIKKAKTVLIHNPTFHTYHKVTKTRAKELVVQYYVYGLNVVSWNDGAIGISKND